MSEVKMSDENVIYCLNYLSEFDAKDIEDDEFDISVNDDQFASMSIVRTAKLGAELAEKLTEQVKLLLCDISTLKKAICSAVVAIENESDMDKASSMLTRALADTEDFK